MRTIHVKQAIWSSCTGRSRAFSTRALVAFAVAGACSAACSSSTTSKEGPVDAAKTSADGGSKGSIDLGFSPSNIACALSATSIARVVADAGIDLSQLGDVDIPKSDEPYVLASDEDRCSDQADCGSHFYFKGSTNTALIYITVAQPNGTKIGVYVAHSWTIELGATLDVQGAFPIALVAETDFTVAGTLAGTGEIPALGSTAAGGYPATSGTSVSSPGEGPGGGLGGSTTGTGIGGGGASYCGKGGPGGAGTATAPTYGSSTLIPLVGGSSGGSEYGGEGGGAIQVVAGGQIIVSGVVTAGGAGGNVGAGGAGSGGAILLEAPTVSVTGTLAANGGGGGTSGDANSGADGLASAMPALGGMDVANGNASGGQGSAGTTTAGSPGQKTAKGGVGGGGGGAGYIRVNANTATVGGVVSPGMSTSCFSQGKIETAAPSCG
jgi:hypothetical protein